ncbi:hypothetical protein GCM10025875_27570 [Litorihabitans aurantiacus]|uniref:Uncharacterized protein n=1 Tax=Litorihabitans aurantiacus TaxID=1930061 RepID=A0AA37XHN0_9MICO|nr:hypothetical protein GCM10025875_27570 [Litorihabitans aurantiacus]
MTVATKAMEGLTAEADLKVSRALTLSQPTGSRSRLLAGCWACRIGLLLLATSATRVARFITKDRTQEGKIYSCVTLNAISRRAVSWPNDLSPTAALTTDAPGMAIESRLRGS